MFFYIKTYLERVMGKKVYSKEDIIKQLQNYYKRNGKITKESFGEDKTVCSGATVMKTY